MQDKKNIYISAEFAIDQSLKIYAGGLGFLAGSHMRAAYQNDLNLVGVGILYSYGYYDQVYDIENGMQVAFHRKQYSFLKDTGITLDINIHQKPVKVKVYLLEKDTFHTNPLYLFSTDIPENDYLSRTITHKLYDANEATRIAQYMLLGYGAFQLVQVMQWNINKYHLNEGHALPLIFKLSKEERKQKVVFTTHTPEMAGNESKPIELLKEMNFFGDLEVDNALADCFVENGRLSFTQTMLLNAGNSNAVSKIHQTVAQKMWGNIGGSIKAITNAQDYQYWKDSLLSAAMNNKDYGAFQKRKKILKQTMFDEVANQTGKLFDLSKMTIVWSRRFAGYKRVGLMFTDMQRLEKLLANGLQLIIAGKPFPTDEGAIELFDKIAKLSEKYPNVAVLSGYELKLSKVLKQGADVWLNTPIFGREASGTSGMSAAFNGTLNCSIADGWMDELSRTCYVEIKQSENLDPFFRDAEEADNLYEVIENYLLPNYDSQRWFEQICLAHHDVVQNFNAGRMVLEYDELYNA